MAPRRSVAATWPRVLPSRRSRRFTFFEITFSETRPLSLTIMHRSFLRGHTFRRSNGPQLLAREKFDRQRQRAAACHPRLQRDMSEPVRNRGNPAQVVLDVLFADPAHGNHAAD